MTTFYEKLPKKIKFTNKAGVKKVLTKKPQPIKKKYFKKAYA